MQIAISNIGKYINEKPICQSIRQVINDMNDLFSTSLYLFSALLQADAALLGFGAIFVIYKFQSIENQFSFLMQEFKFHGSGWSGAASKIRIAKTNEEKAKILKSHLGKDLSEQLEFLSSLSEMKLKISNTIKIPLLISGSHLSLSSVILWIIPQIYKIGFIIQIISWLFICWFIIGVFSAVWVVWILIIKNRDLNLEDVNPKLYKLVHEDN
jgi:hypothetical protein